MTTIVLAFVVMLLLVAAMAVGVLFGRRPIQGSCGGLAQLGADGACEICGGRPEACANPDDSTSGDRTINAVDATRSQNSDNVPR